MLSNIENGSHVTFTPKFGDEIYMQCPPPGTPGVVDRITFDQATIFVISGIILSCCIVRFDGYDYDMLIYTEDLTKIHNYA